MFLPESYVATAAAVAMLLAGDRTGPPVQIIEDGRTSEGNPNPAAISPPASHSFDFEERSLHPWDLPPSFERLEGPIGAAHEAGEYTSFGSIRFDDEFVRSGRWSLRFDLDGGSIGVALRTDERIPAVAGVSYRITCFVRTAGLNHALPRISGHYFDQHGAMIETSFRFMETADTGGHWIEFQILLPAAPAGVASIALALEVLQPEAQRARVNDFEPMHQDVSGQAWFDDVVIERVVATER
jgi:hypothetical protein